MSKKYFVSSAILWAAAIIASAIVGAPAYLPAVLLPGLAATALVIARPKAQAIRCDS